ncbi:MarR family transcriptional regulator [Kocuria rosea]|uniref:MarR family transcriptional regulator n=1 Tax=Kocuria rosea TaxID=1275 RepID=UPI00203C84B9|nr:MarR family transcriptional regulator [Kocuria rosea]MCM3687043.1 MarR family transcriptional regulator [Kocuria rosea]
MIGRRDERSGLLERVLGGLRRYPGVLRTVNDTVARRHGLGPTDAEALLLVLDAEDRGRPLSATQLADALALTTAGTTTVLDRLQARALVERRPDPDDRRRISLHVTAGGHEIAEEILGPAGDAVGAVLEDLDDEELRVLLRTLDALDEALASALRAS